MITTSYFAKAKNIENPVAITAGIPKWFSGKFYKQLAPPIEIVQAYKNNEINIDDYTILYNEFVLNTLDQNVVYNELVTLFGEDATLLCYEKPSDFCHRHLVSAWFQKAGFDVKELKF